MKKKLKICIFSLALIFIFLIPLISVTPINVKNENSQNNQNSENQLEDLKTSDDTSAPIITNVQLSDDMLELRDTQTITCNISDDSEIAFVYLTIWFGSNQENFQMINIIGDKYQSEWSSIGADLGTYNIDIRAQDEWGNAETLENVASFTVVPKPREYVDSLNYKLAQIIGDVDYLKPYDSKELIIEGNQIVDNGNNALYCKPDLPYTYSTLYADRSNTVRDYDQGWSAEAECLTNPGYYPEVLELYNHEWGNARPLFVEHRPKFYVRNNQCPDEDPIDIEITITIYKASYRCLPSFNIYIYNYYTGQWVTLFSAGSNDVFANEWLHNSKYTFNKDDLIPHDPNLSHFIDSNGYVQLRIQAGSSWWQDIWYWAVIPLPPFVIPLIFPHAFVSLITDQCNVKATYCPASTVNFNFEDDDGTNLLNGEDDYYLYFKGKTTNGNAQINVNGEKELDISTLGTIVDEPRPLELYDVSDISITGKFDEVNIDYLYLKKMRDPPIHTIEVTTLEDNKKIKGPMSGYYPGKYGFENDESGTCPEEWLNTAGVSSVIETLNGHNKVLSVGETGVTSNCYIEFPDQSSGIIEFWIRAKANSQTSFYFDKDLLLAGSLTLGATEGNWGFFGHSISGAKANTWYHLKLKFNKVASSIEVYIDGVLIQTYAYTPLVDINRLFLKSNGAYFDAIDFSWSDGFNEDRNINEGYLLDFESYYDLKWISYKILDFEHLEEFDSLPFISVLGDTVIQIPKNGPCIIKAYGKDSEENAVFSKTIEFSVDYNRDFRIIWPKQRAYKSLPFHKFYLLFETIDDIISTQVIIDDQTPIEISEFKKIDPCLVMVNLPILSKGEHQIQLTAINSQGDLYQTDIKEFNFDLEINLEGIQEGDSVKGGADLNLKLDAPVELSELGYILDDEPYTIEGDSFTNLDLLIDISNIGTHTIQAFGYDPYGNEYFSDCKSFTTTPFNIITPESLISLMEEGEEIDLTFDAYKFLEDIQYSIDGQDYIAGDYSEEQVSLWRKQYKTSIGTLDRGYHTIQLRGIGKITGNEYYSELLTFEVVIHDISLICVHGMGGAGSAFDFLKDNTDFTNHYGVENIWAVNYVHEPRDPEFVALSPYSGDASTIFESIRIIAEGLRNYIINRHEAGDLKDNIDLFAHSMGGLVVRYMILYWYPELQAEGITIRHVAIAGTPNHGCWFANMGYFLTWNLNIIGAQLIWSLNELVGVYIPCWMEMATLSTFLITLNAGDETPYDISYYTYAGNTGKDMFAVWAGYAAGFNLFFFITIPLYFVLYNIIGDDCDDLVETYSTRLSGAVANRIYEGICHGAIYNDPIVLADLINDLKT